MAFVAVAAASVVGSVGDVSPTFVVGIGFCFDQRCY
jgi:hypothetical protein